MRKRRVMTGCAAAVCAAGLLAQQNEPRPSAQAGAKRGPTYASLATLPDWTGAWTSYAITHGYMRTHEDDTFVPPLKDPDALAKFQEAQRIAAAGGDNIARAAAAGRGAAPPAGGAAAAGGGGGGRGGFNGTQTLGPVGFMEVLYTPGRITFATDGGNVRRIYMDGTEPDPNFITANGTSVGNWGGSTLVVDTVGLSPKTMLLGVVQAGEGFKVHERIFMKEKEVLEFDTTVETPLVLTGPYHMLPQLFQHEITRVELMQQYIGETAARDRSIDPVTRTQTFDLTPPGDLPPPPPRK